MFDDLLDQLKLYLGIPLDDTENDEALLRALNLAGLVCEKYINTIIAKRETSVDYQSYFGRVILKNLVVDTTEPVTVLLDGVEQTDYTIYQDDGLQAHLTRQNCQHDMPMDWRRYNQIKVTYTAGYDPIPDDLATAIIWTAGDFYKSEGTGTEPGGGGGTGEVKSMSIYDVGSMSFDVGSSSSSSGDASYGVISDYSARLLSPYMRMVA